MPEPPRRPALALLVLLVAGALLIAACGDDDEGLREPPEPEGVEQAPEAEDPAVERQRERERERRRDRRRDEAGERPQRDAGEAAAARIEREVERTIRAYVTAINERDGETLCELLAPGSLRALDPPRRRGGCAETLRASIGYRDPRGFAVWRRTNLSTISSVDTDADPVRATAEIVTEFADRDHPSVESDIAYLERANGGWRLAKASMALYRAVGKPDADPSVIAPP